MPELVSDSFQRGSPSIPSLPLCTCHSSHQKMESIFLLSLNLDWPTTCHNQQNMVEVTLFQFQTWPLRRLAASISSLLDASHHVRNPTTRTPLHCEETPCWEREMPDQPQMFRPSQLSCHLCKWKGHPGHCASCNTYKQYMKRTNTQLSLTQAAELWEIINCCC